MMKLLPRFFKLLLLSGLLLCFFKSSQWVHLWRPRKADPTQTWLEIQTQRKIILNSACLKLNLTDTVNKLKPRVAIQLYVEHNHRLIFCSIPKVGCSNWLRILLILQKNLSSELTKESINRNELLKYIHTTPLLIKLNRYPSTLQQELLSNYTKVMVTRDPFERLVSAYRNKILHGVQSFMKLIKAAFPKSSNNVTFQEFVNFILQEKLNNNHWRPMYKLCDPCRIHYDIIGKIETVNQDADHILKSIGAPEDLHYPTFKTFATEPRTNEQITAEYFGNLSSKQVEQLLKLYEFDFSLFNYSSNVKYMNLSVL
ncbi:carbohydrate sulfotransferase 11-like isoform X1 [Rhinatrema bivittatum]|uniref:carbohydrate sulfotransferase 11-like isoform X1 n=1 Tax=Rhinatrema bivittatum TaxID=194408 RepID=UPI00112E6E19|nr:carbohydrate sulfotransferase 11-like isoform X1 [Rhinatrema bivittatum]